MAGEALSGEAGSFLPVRWPTQTTPLPNGQVKNAKAEERREEARVKREAKQPAKDAALVKQWWDGLEEYRTAVAQGGERTSEAQRQLRHNLGVLQRRGDTIPNNAGPELLAAYEGLEREAREQLPRHAEMRTGDLGTDGDARAIRQLAEIRAQPSQPEPAPTPTTPPSERTEAEGLAIMQMRASLKELEADPDWRTAATENQGRRSQLETAQSRQHRPQLD